MIREKQQTILLVEDSAIIAAEERIILEKHGFAVTVAVSGEEAIRAVENDPGIRLVLMDINLGRGMDGIEAASAILSKRDIPLVFMSSHTDRNVIEKTERVTSYGYIAKDSGETAMIMSIKMAFRLFEANALAKAREKTLRDSEEKFSQAFMHSPVISAIYSIESERFVDVNLRFCEATGFSRDDVIGRSTAALGLFPLGNEKTHAMDAIREKGGIRGIEVHLKRKDGKLIFGLFSAEKILLRGSECWITMMEDITERKRAEYELHSREEELPGIPGK